MLGLSALPRLPAPRGQFWRRGDTRVTAPVTGASKHLLPEPTRPTGTATITHAQDKTRVIERFGLEPSACLAVDDGPHHIDAFEAAGVFGIVLDRWGSYRGDHVMVGDLGDVADLIEMWVGGS